MSTKPPANSGASGGSDSGERNLLDRLTDLHAVLLELSSEETFHGLCRSAVTLGHSRLGFDRLGLWFTTDAPRCMVGSYGIDENGNTRDERSSRVQAHPGSMMGDILQQRCPSVQSGEAFLFNDAGQAIGKGMHAIAALWNGRDIIGCISADNFLLRKPITQHDCKLLELYASAIGHLCTQRRAQEALTRSEEQYRVLMEEAGDAIVVCSDDAVILGANRAAVEVLGGAKETLVGMNIADFLLPHDAHAVAIARERVLSGETVTEEREITLPDGRTIVVEARFRLLPDGRVLGIIRDTTVQKRMDDVRHGNEARLREFEEMISRSPAMVFRWRLESGFPVDFVSKNVQQLGYTTDDLLSGRVSWVDITHPEDHRRLEREVSEFLEKGVDEWAQMYRLKTAAGEYRWVEDRNRVIRDSKGEPRAVEGIVLDVTERMHLQDELLAVAQREQQSIGRALHDGLGQELTGITYLAKALESSLERQGIPDAETAGRIAQLVGASLVQTRRIAHGLSPVDFGDVGLAEALRELARGAAQLYRIVCVCRIAKRVDVTESTAATYLYLIAQEALANAVRHGQARRITVSLSASRGKGRLVVSDNGRGFVRTVTGGKPGLGLSTMEFRARAIGGAFEVESEPGKGTRVICLFDHEPSAG